MKYDILVIDPPYEFSDQLLMSKVKRGTKSQYKSTLSDDDILNLDIKNISADDSLIVLWVPSAYLNLGMKCLESWGFTQKQTWIWVKTKKRPLEQLHKKIFKSLKTINDFKSFKKYVVDIVGCFDINNILSFYMGHYFRGTHEIALVGVRGKMTKKVQNKAQRSVFLGPVGEHSEKPEALQDMLDIMFPDKKLKRVEFFARRVRDGWDCYGNECPNSSLNQDVRDSIKEIQNAK